MRTLRAGTPACVGHRPCLHLASWGPPSSERPHPAASGPHPDPKTHRPSPSATAGGQALRLVSGVTSLGRATPVSRSFGRLLSWTSAVTGTTPSRFGGAWPWLPAGGRNLPRGVAVLEQMGRLFLKRAVGMCTTVEINPLNPTCEVHFRGQISKGLSHSGTPSKLG